MKEVLKEEYLTLREEVQRNLSAQKEWSLFAIATTVTILGFAVNMKYASESAALCILPFLILFMAATKVRNYKLNISRIVGYMIVRHESSDGFFWETCLKEYRTRQKNSCKIYGCS